MRRVARAAEVKRALDDARKSDDGDGDGDEGDDGGTKGPGRAAAARRRRRRSTSRGTPCSGSGAARSRANTVSERVERANRAASARPSRANVGGVSGGVSVSVASPPRWNVVANVAKAAASIGADLSAAASRTKPHVASTKSQLAARTDEGTPRSSRVDVPDDRPGRVDSESTRRFARERLRRRRRRRQARAGSFESMRGEFRPRRSNSACRAARRRATGPPWGCAAAYPRVRARVRNRRRRGARPTTRRRRWRARRCSRVFDRAARRREGEGDEGGTRQSPRREVRRPPRTIRNGGRALPRERRDGETRFGEKRRARGWTWRDRSASTPSWPPRRHTSRRRARKGDGTKGR